MGTINEIASCVEQVHLFYEIEFVGSGSGVGYVGINFKRINGKHLLWLKLTLWIF